MIIFPYVSISQLINAARHYAIISYPGHVIVIHSLTCYTSAISVHACLSSLLLNEMPSFL